MRKAETKREGLSDEQKAIFDILRQGKELARKEKDEIKKIAVELLEELKKEKLQVEQWSDKSVTAAAVFNYVNKTLFEVLPYPDYEEGDIDLKTNMVYAFCYILGCGQCLNSRRFQRVCWINT